MTLIPFDELYDGELCDPERSSGYLSCSAEEDGREGLLSALGDVVRANGGMARIAEKTGLNRENLFRALSRDGDPKLSTVLAVLNALGLQMSITPIGALDKAMAERYAAEQADAPRELAAVG